MGSMKRNNFLLFAGIGIALYFLTGNKKPSRWEQLTYLNTWAERSDQVEYLTNQFIQMTDQELFDTYTFIHDYFENGDKPVPVGSALQLRLIALSNKYNIFA